MKNKLVTGFALAALVAGLSSAANAQNLAIVNGKAVPLSRVEALSQQVARSGRQITPEIEKQIKDEVIAREIFLQEAHKQGLDTTEDFKVQMELARQTILIRDLFTNYQKANAVTDADIKAEYDKFAAANSGKEYKARHILIAKKNNTKANATPEEIAKGEVKADAEALAKTKAIIAQLKKGGKFEDIAKKESDDPGSKVKGGDLDWASAGNYVAEFAQALAALTKGKMTETPVKSQFGYHIIRLDDVRDAQLPALETVKPQVAQQLQQQKLAKYQEELRSKAKVE